MYIYILSKVICFIVASTSTRSSYKSSTQQTSKVSNINKSQRKSCQSQARRAQSKTEGVSSTKSQNTVLKSSTRKSSSAGLSARSKSSESTISVGISSHNTARKTKISISNQKLTRNTRSRSHSSSFNLLEEASQVSRKPSVSAKSGNESIKLKEERSNKSSFNNSKQGNKLPKSHIPLRKAPKRELELVNEFTCMFCLILIPIYEISYLITE